MIAKGLDVFKDDAKFETFYAALDSDHDGKVDLRELICGFAVLVDGSLDEKLGVAFRTFDRNNDNYIQPQELELLMGALLKVAHNGNLPDEETQFLVSEFTNQAFADYDKNSDGKLSFEEFLQAAHDNPSIGNLFLVVSHVVH